LNSSRSEEIDRTIDFSYDTCWFECPECDDRVVMTFEDRAAGESRTCRCGHDVSAQEEYPAPTNPFDVALDPAAVENLVWYHTTTRADWPPTDESPSASATHLGTFESAIENMFRRMRDQSDADSQCYLQRVRIACPPAEVSPLGQELSDFMGNVWLGALYETGYPVVRYVNVHEHPGSISLAVVPAVITRVQTLAVPLSLDTDESMASREIFAGYAAELNEVEARRRSTDAISRMEYLMPKDPQTAAVVEVDSACDQAVWAAENGTGGRWRRNTCRRWAFERATSCWVRSASLTATPGTSMTGSGRSRSWCRTLPAVSPLYKRNRCVRSVGRPGSGCRNATRRASRSRASFSVVARCRTYR
jgi:hypothetical protein